MGSGLFYLQYTVGINVGLPACQLYADISPWWLQDGDEAVVATKLTGDPNVPAGHISFSAKINRSNRLSARDAYPLELGVLGRYRGTGRVARSGYKEAR